MEFTTCDTIEYFPIPQTNTGKLRIDTEESETLGKVLTTKVTPFESKKTRTSGMEWKGMLVLKSQNLWLLDMTDQSQKSNLSYTESKLRSLGKT